MRYLNLISSITLFTLLLAATSCTSIVKGLSILHFNEQLATRWAPIHHQDVDVSGGNSLGGRSDYITSIDFDGDWVTTNNWEHTDDFPLTAHAYYSVVWTSTHWFIVYAFYHPRDWCDSFGCSIINSDHENDLEGLLAIVRRPEIFSEENFGTLEAIVTVFHNDFVSFKHIDSNFTQGEEDIEGFLTMQTFNGVPHPVTAQQAKGHGLKAYPHVKIEGDYGIIYRPTEVAQEPNDPNDRDVGYKLINLFLPGNMWARRNNSETFTNDGAFQGDDGANDAANAPWAWDDSNDGSQLTGGELATDPAKLTQIYFNDLGIFSTIYTYNPYQDIGCDYPERC
ncbi:MAG: hypothetical protein ABW092_18505 [Candidatus Thiodiazotropha sp.]